MEIVGTLKNARRIAVGEDSRAPCLAGAVYGDVKGRFFDGERITTSTIMEELPDGIFKTRFSAYRVENWAADKDGWIEWNGGSCPVEALTGIEIRFRGERMTEDWPCVRPEQLEWDHDGGAGDIVAYRLAAPANDNTPALTKRAQFDAMTPEQEALAINISMQIAAGVRPDPVTILEWANDLYVAEVGVA